MLETGGAKGLGRKGNRRWDSAKAEGMEVMFVAQWRP